MRPTSEIGVISSNKRLQEAYATYASLYLDFADDNLRHFFVRNMDISPLGEAKTDEEKTSAYINAAIKFVTLNEIFFIGGPERFFSEYPLMKEYINKTDLKVPDFINTFTRILDSDYEEQRSDEIVYQKKLNNNALIVGSMFEYGLINQAELNVLKNIVNNHDYHKGESNIEQLADSQLIVNQLRQKLKSELEAKGAWYGHEYAYCYLYDFYIKAFDLFGEDVCKKLKKAYEAVKKYDDSKPEFSYEETEELQRLDSLFIDELYKCFEKVA